MNRGFSASVVAGIFGANCAFAAGDHAHHANTATAATTSPASMAMTAGEVRRVDVERSKLTIKHDAIATLGMPAMTMIFRVSKAELLKDLKARDKILFAAESVGGEIVITHIQATK